MSKPNQHNIFRDGAIHVKRNRCATCIFRPGNLMQLRPGRVKGMVRKAQKDEGSIVCHDTLGTKPKRHAVCRGFFELYPTAPLQIAERLGFIREVE